MDRFLKFILLICSVFLSMFVQAQKDTCNVQSYVRADGVMIRGVDFETIYSSDTNTVAAAMYSIDKDYFLVISIQSNGKKITYSEDISIQLSDSTVILLSYDSFKSDRAKKTYEVYFKINNKDLGYIEKYDLVRMNYQKEGKRISVSIQQHHKVLQRHYACLRKK